MVASSSVIPGAKNTHRTTSYPINDGINYEGIDFPTPINQTDKLEAQNENLAINVFGWSDRVIVYRVSKKTKEVNRINLMLIESGEKQHYTFVKRINALLNLQSDKTQGKQALLFDMFNGVFEKRNSGRTRKTLRGYRRQANENRNAK